MPFFHGELRTVRIRKSEGADPRRVFKGQGDLFRKRKRPPTEAASWLSTTLTKFPAEAVEIPLRHRPASHFPPPAAAVAAPGMALRRSRCPTHGPPTASPASRLSSWVSGLVHDLLLLFNAETIHIVWVRRVSLDRYNHGDLDHTGELGHL